MKRDFLINVSIHHVSYVLIISFLSTSLWFEYISTPLLQREVPKISIESLVEKVREGGVLFIDTREPEEFAEYHIPGAINLPIYRLSSNDLVELKSAKMVVPYCVKDFRGYEVAKTLLSFGLTNIAVMTPSGLKGWGRLGLPITGELMNVKEGGERISEAFDDNKLPLLSFNVR